MIKHVQGVHENNEIIQPNDSVHNASVSDINFDDNVDMDDGFSKKNDPRFRGKIASTAWVLLKKGKIETIRGMDEIKSDKNVVFTMERFKEGDSVLPEWIGTERQVYTRIYLVTDTIEEMNAKIAHFKNSLVITDEQQRDMILTWMEPIDPLAYKQN